MNTARELLTNLLAYIKEQAKDINPHGYRIGNVKSFAKNRQDVAGLPGVEFDIKLQGDHIWMQVPRLTAEPAPKIAEEYKLVFRASSEPSGPSPSIDEKALASQLRKDMLARGILEPPNREEFERKVRSAAARALESYTAAWNSWAAGELPRRKTISLYADLFTLMHQMEAEETNKPLELVWGIGVSSWLLSHEGKQVVYEYPALTQEMEVALDEQSMCIELRPRGVDTRVELDALIECQVKGATEIEKQAKEQLLKRSEQTVTPFDPSSYADVLKLIAGNLDSQGAFVEVLKDNSSVPPAGEHLVVTDSWVMLSRPRTINYLFEDLRRLRQRLEGGCEIPDGPRSLVTPPSDLVVEPEPVTFRGLSSRGSTEAGNRNEELFFALPYNDEQETIIRHLKNAPGVTVQGPPGTGKTHTIANIICHYVATGRRVLVTSRGETALREVQNKLPAEVVPLTVALLTSDREGIRQFQASIEAIQHRVSQLSTGLTQQEINTLKSSINRAHSELANADRRIDEIAFSQLADVEVDGVLMRPQKIAELVVTGQETHGWFDDLLSLRPEHAPPLSEDETAALRKARRLLGHDIIYVQAQVPSADDLPPQGEMAKLHEILIKRDSIEAEIRRGDLLSLRAPTPEVLRAARELLVLIEQAMGLVEDIENTGQQWSLELRTKCRNPAFDSERAALEALFAELDAISAARAEFLKTPVSFPSAGYECEKTILAVRRAAEAGKPFGLLAFGGAESKSHIAAIRIAGREPSTQEDWAHVNAYVELHQRSQSFSARWNELAGTLSVPILQGGAPALRELELTASAARKAHHIARACDPAMTKQARNVFETPPIPHLMGSSVELGLVRNHVIKHLTLSDLSAAATQLGDFHRKLAGKGGPISDALRDLLGRLGDPRISKEKVSGRYEELLSELRRIATLTLHLATISDLARKIEEGGGTKLAARLRSEPVTPSGEDATFPTSWREAWNFARMRTHLESLESRAELLSLAQRRRELEAGLTRFYKELVAKSAWLATKQKATPRVLQALAGYATAIRRIGQGTGPNATRYRRNAREAMFDAAGAIPCWIMSHSRVSESMPADIGAFDLVIVDEASQSDLWALPAILRGKQILVVGDDKQVSPDAGFIEASRIQLLINRFLLGQPYAAEMTPEKSLYDLAARVFAAYQVMLREHFRCVPPIIAYSNRTFYKNQILPLRVAKASERIEPPLIDIFVEGGTRDEHDRNDFEAQAIADEINEITKDDKLKGRTIGVISLLGMDQAKHIDAVVTKKCDAAELHRRKFICGDARTFQGSERDIMFLSLVVDATNCKALAGNMFDQRFNVAASRARDRMYLVRSVTASHLSDRDLRKTLLSHFENPLVADKEEAETLSARCESNFERQVYSELVARGYCVTPQVRTGAYRIDMVVEGLHDTRLAIECDGDEYHGPDRWQDDTKRQRVLERAGWVFWRCFASTWVLRKEDVLAELLQRLYSMGIEPLGSLKQLPSLVESRTWGYKEPGKEGQVWHVEPAQYSQLI